MKTNEIDTTVRNILEMYKKMNTLDQNKVYGFICGLLSQK